MQKERVDEILQRNNLKKEQLFVNMKYEHNFKRVPEHRYQHHDKIILVKPYLDTDTIENGPQEQVLLTSKSDMYMDDN